MQLDHPTEMEAVDGKCNCRWEEVRTPEQGLEKEPPLFIGRVRHRAGPAQLPRFAIRLSLP